MPEGAETIRLLVTTKGPIAEVDGHYYGVRDADWTVPKRVLASTADGDPVG